MARNGFMRLNVVHVQRRLVARGIPGGGFA